ncbi:MAG: transcriptional regulator [Microbacterium sp.]
MMPHPRHRLDPAFQTPIRFSLMAALRRDADIEFGILRDLLEADDSSLSKAIAHLARTNYVRITKGYVGSRPRTWISITAYGERAYADHLTALRAIAGE